MKATLQARYEEEGGVSVAVYDLTFSGTYDLTHTGDVTATVDLFFPFPANLETYHEVTFLVDREEPEDAVYSTAGIAWRTEMAPGDSFAVEISYQAEGANSFSYGLMQNQRTDIDIAVDVIGMQGACGSQRFTAGKRTGKHGKGRILVLALYRVDCRQGYPP